MLKKAAGLLLAAVLLAPVTANLAFGQDKTEKKAKAQKDMRVDGRVKMVDKNASEMTVQKGNIERKVGWTSDTKFTYRNQSGSIDDVKDGVRVICLGKFEGVKLMASRIDVREKKP